MSFVEQLLGSDCYNNIKSTAYCYKREPKYIVSGGYFSSLRSLMAMRPEKSIGSILFILKSLMMNTNKEFVDCNFFKDIFEPFNINKSDLNNFVIHFGPEGIYLKPTILFFDDDLALKFCIKIGDNKETLETIKNEFSVLSRLDQLPSLADSLPTNIALASKENMVLLYTDCMPYFEFQPANLAPRISFLEKMKNETLSCELIEYSNFFTEVVSLYENIMNDIPLEWRTLYDECFLLITKRKNVQLSFCCAHRDFTPWNAPISAKGKCYVFDWEFSREQYPMNYDLIHYIFFRDVYLARISHYNKFKKLMNFYNINLFDQLLYFIDITLFYWDSMFKKNKIGSGKIHNISITYLNYIKNEIA